MTIAIYIYLIVILVHGLIRAFLYPIYFSLTPRQKIEKGYLRWTENFKYNHQTWKIKGIPETDLRKRTFVHYRKDILLKGLFRCVFKKPVRFKKELSRLNATISDVNAIDPAKYFELKKKNKIHF